MTRETTAPRVAERGPQAAGLKAIPGATRVSIASDETKSGAAKGGAASKRAEIGKPRTGRAQSRSTPLFQ